MDNPFHLIPFLLLLVALLYGITGYFKHRAAFRNGTAMQHIKDASAITVINMAVLFSLGFNIVFFVQELFLALGKRWLGLTAYLFHNNHNWDGSHPKESLAQGLGAVAIFIFAIVLLPLLKFAKKSSWQYVFLLWLSFLGFAQSLPQFISAFVVKRTDTGQAFTYLQLSDTAGLLISLAGVFLMLWIAAKYSKMFLSLSGPAVAASVPARFSFLFRFVFLAAILGSVLCIPYRILPWSRAILPFMVTLNVMPMVWAYGWKVRDVKTHENIIHDRILAWPVLFALLMLLFFQLVLARGVVL